MLDATLDLLVRMKDFLESPPVKQPNNNNENTTDDDIIVLDEKKTSVLEQLGVLSTMMGYNSQNENNNPEIVNHGQSEQIILVYSEKH
jgi:hypothetical protein